MNQALGLRLKLAPLAGCFSLFVLCVLALPLTAVAGKPEVVNAVAQCNSERTCSFDVTVRHDDEGWDHYANKWEVATPEGKIIGTRVLHHPHEDEQPFTRSLSNVHVPEEVREIHVFAYDSVHGRSEQPFIVRME